MKLNALRSPAVSLSAIAILASAGAALATEGSFQDGFGARQKAMAGAGVADGKDATSTSLNPAGLIHSPNEFSMAVTYFTPERNYHGSGQPGFTPQGGIESGSHDFFIPNMAWASRAYANPLFDVVGISLYGSGGMNTNWPAVTGGAFCPAPGAGVYCGGQAGVNLNQAGLSVAIAKQLAPGLSVGVAPILVRQQFRAEGLGAFGAFGLSNDPGHLTNHRNDVVWGGGVRAGIEWALLPSVRLGVAGHTPMWVAKSDKYAGLFANAGEFDIPPSFQAGVSIDLSPKFTVSLDYRRIFYTYSDAISNPSANAVTCALSGGAPGAFCLGGANGAGFGWTDINVYKVGAEWRAMPNLTLRAGYSYNDNPVKPADVMFNILAPGVVQHNITGGLKYDINADWSLELAGAYRPENKVTGGELPGLGNPNHIIEISMSQWEATVGLVYRFGERGGSSEPVK